MSRRRNPVRAAEALEGLTRSIEPPGTLAAVQRAWPEAVGETIARWARPDSERAGVVTVACRDSVVAHELEMMKPQLLEQLSAALGSAPPADLRFRVRAAL